MPDEPSDSGAESSPRSPEDATGSPEAPETDDPGDVEVGGVGRRDLLKYGFGGAVTAGLAGGGYLFLSEDSSMGQWSAGDAVDRETVERFAPVVQFGARERWYPTDPRKYAEERDGETVVDGFAALDGYTTEFREADAPPDPVVFYRTLAEENSSLGVVQYWMYSAFDQFAVNFHWHDWELVQVFFDRETGDAVLVSASAHSRKVPNNEHIGGSDDRVGILSEVGSHSSATDVDRNGQFLRAETGGFAADVTNALVRIAEDRNPVPLAYGLPRGEGAVLPYVVPELDGTPLYDHPDLPNVRQEDLIDEPLAIRDLASLPEPPTGVPSREPGLAFVPPGDDAGEDRVAYELAPVAPVAEELDDFAGPQLSFEFAVPGVVEDQLASHITSVGLPWEQPRYEVPLADVTDGDHRERLAGRFDLDAPPADDGTVVAQVQEAVDDVDGELRDAPDAARQELEPEIGYTLSGPSVESVALVGEDPVAVPTVGGQLLVTGLEPGEHRLVLDGAGYAPHAERLQVGDDANADATDATTDATTTLPGEESPPNRPGDGGYLTAVRKKEAVKLRAESTSAPGDVDRVRVAEDYAGAAFDGRPPEDPDAEDGFAVYVHREGSYVVDVVDEDGVPGTERVRPGRDADDADGDEDGSGEAVDLAGETGKASLGEFLGEYLLESADLTREYRRDDGDTDDSGGGNDEDGNGNETDGGNGGGGDGAPGVPELFESAAGAADRAAEFARDGQFDQADTQLETVRQRLDALRTRIEAQRGGVLPDTLATVLTDRVEGSDRRAIAALEADR